jgi:hypothetical protein
MTCEDVREHLLTADIGDLDSVRTHLSQCARCASLAAAVAHAEADLRQHVETFVSHTTLDAQWAQALDRAGPAPRARFPLHRLVVALAAAAVLAVIAVPALRSPGSGGPPGQELLGVGAVPEVLREAQDRVQAFERIDTEHLDVDGLDREAEDKLLRETLQSKVQAMSHAEEALAAATSAGEPRWRVLAYRDLGGLHAEMAEVVRHFPSPSYLTDDQRTVYRQAIVERGFVQQQRAAGIYTQGADLARQSGLDAMAAELDSRVLELSVSELRARLDANSPCLEGLDKDRLRADLERRDAHALAEILSACR